MISLLRTMSWSILLLAAACGMWFATRSPAGEAIQSMGPREAPAAQPQRKGIGTAGCLAAACHGGPAEQALAGKFDSKTWECSGACWLAVDPHGGAFDLLTDTPRRRVKATASQIMSRLGGGNAAEEVRCLACHTNPALASTGPSGTAALHDLRREGVSCEACHGNAGDWLREHTTWPPTWTAAERAAILAATGMSPLNDLGDRAMSCMGCHVGAPADPDRGYPLRDMNHDMIAAGHPRLDFDFAEYLGRLPKHWQEKDRTGLSVPGHEFPARSWYIGRVARAEAVCMLLADRAGRASRDGTNTPWPEFAEYNCAACHHALDPGGRAAGPKRTSQGLLRWQSLWPMTDAGPNSLPELERLRSQMQVRRAVRPEAVQPLAESTALRLASVRQSLDRLPAAETMRLVKVVFAGPLPDLDGEDLRQLFHGLAALERTRLESGRTSLKHEAFDLARAQLRGQRWLDGRVQLGSLWLVVPGKLFEELPK